MLALGFNENAGSTAADASGRNNHASLGGATWAAGKHGAGLSFDGTASLVTVADSAGLNPTGALTLEAWIKPTTLSGWRTVLMKEAAGGLIYTLYAYDNAPRPAVYIHTTTDIDIPGTAAPPLNAWTHLAATYDGAQLRLYENGIQVASRAATGALSTSTGALRIGGNAVWGEYFAGVIDEVRVFNRALSAAEIQADMTTPISGGGGVTGGHDASDSGDHVARQRFGRVRCRQRLGDGERQRRCDRSAVPA